MNGDCGKWLWHLMAFFYDKFFILFPPYQKLLNSILKSLEKNTSEHLCILDAGCGTGLISVAIARNHFTVVGVDLSEEMLKQARKKKKTEKLDNLFLFKRDLNEEFNIHGFLFNKILFIHSLNLFENPKKILRDFATRLPRLGEIILCVPARGITKNELFKEGISYSLEIIRKNGMLSFLSFLPIIFSMGFLNLIIQRQKRKRIVHCWQREEILNLIDECGFELNRIEESCIAQTHFLISALRR